MTREELEDLSDDKLRELAQERGKGHKNGKRSFTSRARTAQLILWRRAGEPFTNSYSWRRDHTPVKKM